MNNKTNLSVFTCLKMFIKAVSDTVLDMINTAYYAKPLILIRAIRLSYQGCFWHCVWHDKCRLLWQSFDFYRGYTFEFIKAVSDTVLDMINAVYHDNPLIFTKAVSDTILDTINAVHCDKPLIFIGATFREKLVFYRPTVVINCWISLSLSRLFLTL